MNKRITVLLLSIMLLISCAACFTGCNKKANSPGNAIPEDIDGPAKFTVTALSVSDKIKISYTLELEPGCRWLFQVETDEPVICVAILPGGEKITQKKDDGGWLEFTTPERAGKTQLRIWIGGLAKDKPVLLRSVQLHRMK